MYLKILTEMKFSLYFMMRNTEKNLSQIVVLKPLCFNDKIRVK